MRMPPAPRTLTIEGDRAFCRQVPAEGSGPGRGLDEEVIRTDPHLAPELSHATAGSGVGRVKFVVQNDGHRGGSFRCALHLIVQT